MLKVMPPTQSSTPHNLDFILQTEQPKPQRFGAGSSKTRRIIVVVVGAIFLLILAFVFLSLAQRGSRQGSAELVDLAAYQTELVRVVDIGVKNSPDSSVQGIARTASLTLTSDLGKTKNMIASKNVRLGESDLAKYVTSSIDTDLEAAKTANNFDAVFTKLIDEKLSDYKLRLANVYAAQNDTKIRNTLRTFNAHAVLLPFTYSP